MTCNDSVAVYVKMLESSLYHCLPNNSICVKRKTNFDFCFLNSVGGIEIAAIELVVNLVTLLVGDIL